MASFIGNRQTTESYKTVAVPQSLQSNDSPMAMKGKVRQVSIPSITGDQKGTGTIRFVLPNTNNSISRRTMFLRARCTLAFTATLPSPSTTNNNIWFQGPGIGGASSNGSMIYVNPMYTLTNAPGNPNNVTSTPQLGNAYSLLQCSTVYAGSKAIDRIDYLCDFMSGLILPHNTNTGWIQGDGNVMLGIGTPPVLSTTATTGGFIYWDLAIPIPHSCFNTERDFPNFMLSTSNPLSIEIDLTPINRAIAYGSVVTTNGAPSDYTLSRIALCYESVELPREFVEAQRASTTSFIIPQLSYLITQMPISQLANYNATLNMSSLRAMYILPSNRATYVSQFVVATSFNYVRNAGDVAALTATGEYSGTNAQLYLDNELVNQTNLDSPVMTYVALKQALSGSITNYTNTSLAAMNYQYKNCYFAIGIDTTNFSDQSTVMGGTPVNKAQILLTNFITNATTGSYLANCIFAYDSLLIFKNGKIDVRK